MFSGATNADIFHVCAACVDLSYEVGVEKLDERVDGFASPGRLPRDGPVAPEQQRCKTIKTKQKTRGEVQTHLTNKTGRQQKKYTPVTRTIEATPIQFNYSSVPVARKGICQEHLMHIVSATTLEAISMGDVSLHTPCVGSPGG